MIWVSLFKPMGIFEGSFNRFAAWWTAGEYCHCEIVFEVEPSVLMSAVKNVYKKMSGTDKDHQKICAELESVFFENRENKKLIQGKNKVYVSFSLIWGDQLRVRFLMDIEDPWFSSPEKRFKDITWLKCNDIKNNKQKETLEWALTQITKPYNSSAALFSWVPSFGVDDVTARPAYFCSEFAAMCLVRMAYLKPLATHRCTPNHLGDLINHEENSREVKVLPQKPQNDTEIVEELDDNTPKRSSIQLLEDARESSPSPNYVSSSDDDISTIEEELNKHQI